MELEHSIILMEAISMETLEMENLRGECFPLTKIRILDSC